MKTATFTAFRMFVAATAALAISTLAAPPVQAGDLKVTVAGVRSNAGAVMVGLYDSPERFRRAISNSAHVGLLSDKGRMIGVTMRARTGSEGISFLDLPPGRYAIIVFHDEDDNGLLDMNLLGIPTEGYGFSNNASGFFSAPSFDAAAVTIPGSGTGTDKSLTIGLTYQIAASPRSRVGK